jgi:hypothetical protein
MEEEMKDVMQLLEGSQRAEGWDTTDDAMAKLAALDLNRPEHSTAAAAATDKDMTGEAKTNERKAGTGTDEGRAHVKSLLQSAFKDWLVSSGNYQQIADLVRLASHPKSSSATAPPTNKNKDPTAVFSD